MAYTIHFTEQSIEGTSGDPFFNKSFVLNNGKYIELASSGIQGGAMPLVGNPPTNAPNPFLLTGKESEDWGEVVNENFLKLIENQASFEISSDSGTLTAVPQSHVNDTAIRGQLWYNLTDDHLYVYGRNPGDNVDPTNVANLGWHQLRRSDQTVNTANTATLALTLSSDGTPSGTPLPASTFVLRAGDTMTGFLTLNADPTSLTHAATKRYVDDQITGVLSGVVTSFNSRLGSVLPLAGDYDASQINFTTCGTLTSTNVQDAICELETNVASLSSGLDSGQSWQDVSGSRFEGILYTNTTGNIMNVNIVYHVTSAANLQFEVDGMKVCQDNFTSTTARSLTFSAIIPNGSTYRLVLTSGTFTSSPEWYELRV